MVATLMATLLGDMGVIPLGAHLFIFYFGMMSMVTPPVALAAYTASAIADAPVMKTALAGFRFALIGFVLPYAFVLHPELLLIPGAGGVGSIALYLLRVVVALFPLAAGIGGFWLAPLGVAERLVLVVAALVILLTGSWWVVLGGVVVVGAVLARNAKVAKA